jgi:hypothetical protein
MADLGNIKMELSIWISLISHIGRLERRPVISLAAEFFTTCSRLAGKQEELTLFQTSCMHWYQTNR